MRPATSYGGGAYGTSTETALRSSAERVRVFVVLLGAPGAR